MKPTTLYRFFNAGGDLLYVGISGAILERLRQHETGKRWWESVDHVSLQHFRTRAEALSAELQAIRTERPLLNVAHRVTDAQIEAAGVHFEELRFQVTTGLVALGAGALIPPSWEDMREFRVNAEEEPEVWRKPYLVADAKAFLAHLEVRI